MLIVFWCVVGSLFAVVSCIIAKTYFSKTSKVFFTKTKQQFNIEKTLLEILMRKIQNLPEVQFFVNLERFTALGLIYAPVYVLDKKKLGQTHIDLLARVFEKINAFLNLVIINGVVQVTNPKINLVILDKNKISYEDRAMLNILNTNINHSHKQVNSTMCESLDFDFDMDSLIAVANIEKGVMTQIVLPKPYYNYLMKGKRNSVGIYDIFGQNLAKFKGSFIADLKHDKLLIKPTKNSKLQCEINLKEEDKIKLELLNFQIVCENFSKEIEQLRYNAMLELNKNLFVAKGETRKIKVKDLKTFFKLTNLRKNYFNDYQFLLKYIFGLRLNGDILSASPSQLIDFDFSVKYRYKSKDYTVNYSHIDGDKVKLNYVGHKLGHNEDYVYGF